MREIDPLCRFRGRRLSLRAGLSRNIWNDPVRENGSAGIGLLAYRIYEIIGQLSLPSRSCLPTVEESPREIAAAVRSEDPDGQDYTRNLFQGRKEGLESDPAGSIVRSDAHGCGSSNVIFYNDELLFNGDRQASSINQSLYALITFGWDVEYVSSTRTHWFSD